MTSTDLARDAEARRAVVDDLDRTLFLEAGAGSGKTSCLVDRFLALVESGVAADHIAAITFTEKAAGELVDRIRGELERRTREGSVSCSDALSVLDRAAIGTLHSFAQRILTEHPIEAGLPPRITVLDEIASQVAFEDRWDEYVDELLDDPAMEQPLRLLLASGGKPAHLHDVALVFDANWDLVADRAGLQPPTVPPLDVSGLLTKLEEVAALGEHCTSSTDKLLAHINGPVQEFTQRLREAVDDDTRLELLTAAKARPQLREEEELAQHRHRRREGTARRTAGRLRGAAPQRSGGGAAGARVVAGGLHRPRRRGPPARGSSSSSTTSSCSPAPCCAMPTRVPVCALRSRRATSGCSSTSSRTPTRSRSSSRSSSRRIDPAAGQKDWWTVATEPGRLFFVGDPKQSIYRFRRADIGMFLKARDELVGSCEALTQNFRTGRRFSSGSTRRSRHSSRKSPARSPRTCRCCRCAPRPVSARPWRLSARSTTGSCKADQLREAEAADVAGTIRRAVREGWSVGERGPDGTDVWRSARWSRHRDLAAGPHVAAVPRACPRGGRDPLPRRDVDTGLRHARDA